MHLTTPIVKLKSVGRRTVGGLVVDNYPAQCLVCSVIHLIIFMYMSVVIIN